jgi:hypothetical protein
MKFHSKTSSLLDTLVTKNTSSDREGIHASDAGKPALDLYFRMTGEPTTNEPTWRDKIKWWAGLGIEEGFVRVLKDSSIVPEDYDQDVHGVVERNIEGVLVTGHMDGNTTLDQTGEPIEIKTFNNMAYATIKELKENTPRKSYVQQLAMYMHLTGAQLGHLFVLSIDGKNTFHFECKPLGDGRYKCGSVVVNPGKELERLIRIYKENVLTKTMPDIWEHKYKEDIESIDWSSLSTNAISEARNNKRVIGSTEVHYSNWKDKIIKLQGSTLGYNDLELMRIKELTKGFSVKK